MNVSHKSESSYAKRIQSWVLCECMKERLSYHIDQPENEKVIISWLIAFFICMAIISVPIIWTNLLAHTHRIQDSTSMLPKHPVCVKSTPTGIHELITKSGL